MKRSRYKFKKTYLIFFISTFILGNVSPGLNSTILATTNDYKDDFELKIQDESTPDVTLEQPPKEEKSNVSEVEVLYSGVDGTCEWEIDLEGVLHIGTGTLSGKWGWQLYSSSVQKIVFEGVSVAPTSLANMFNRMQEVKSIENISNLDTSRVTDMSNMFAFMSSLISLDLSSFDTSQVTHMTTMFQEMNSLTSLDLSSFDTSRITNMNSMLRNMYSLRELTLGPKIESISTTNLSNIKVTDVYEGTWINVGSGTVADPKGNNIWTSEEFRVNYNKSHADTYVWKLKEKQLNVEAKIAEIPLGTNISDIDLNDFIESVKLDDVELSKDEYTIELKNSIKTTKIDNQNVELEVSLKNDSSKVADVPGVANIVWGSTLVAKDSILNGTDVSVSLLHKNGKPYLKANEGEGFSSRDTLSTRPMYRFYRDSEENFLFEAHYWSIGNSHSEVEERWNRLFSEKVLEYGDVVIADIRKDNNAFSWNGNNTFISKNNMLVRETIGYDYAYYELTPSGYRLLRLNQLVVNNNQKVKLNASKEEMNKNISNYISLPEQIENPNDFRMEFESVDTASSGNKKSTINVYETLESGGEFKTTYEVAYTVYPEITESYYDVDGKQLEQSQTTEFEYGKEFAPSPEKYIENNGVLYIYKGWVDALPGTGAIIPQEGIPAPTLVEKNYYYIYEKADKFINVTLPTEVVFGTFDSNNKISSKKYEIKNNSDELPIEVSLEQFDKVTSDIKLLSSNTPDPTQEEASAKLNLYVDNKSVISGLTEDTPTQSITKIDTNTSRAISLEGTYFGNMSDKNILDYKMHLKFKAARDNKN
ncbi:BspA family leucine-rich repeat surface protein [Lactococcus garvieae]|uniref:BspA family leucine-rich repeat surface protein n=1 Tax=Lactococcus TaxID=1357 RepID=UPI0020970572|nr:BspA family leucine-rich repeat surface protein [Lactococcus formosensis]MCO7179858.1 BspA family leucine-rich repeat surface protein [Lactococcus formosensis]